MSKSTKGYISRLDLGISRLQDYIMCVIKAFNILYIKNTQKSPILE